MKVNLSRESVLANELMPPNWYPFAIKKVEHDQDKDGADLDKFHLQVVDGEYKDKVLILYTSEKFLSPECQQLYEALLGCKITKDGVTLANGQKVPVDQFSVDHDDLVGKTGMMKTRRGEYNGKPQDQIEGFRPLKKA